MELSKAQAVLFENAEPCSFATQDIKAHTHLHGADAETAMDDELTQGRRALVAVTSMNHEQSAQVLELSDGEICSQRRLLPFLKTQTQTNTSTSYRPWKKNTVSKWRRALYIHISHEWLNIHKPFITSHFFDLEWALGTPQLGQSCLFSSKDIIKLLNIWHLS